MAVVDASSAIDGEAYSIAFKTNCVSNDAAGPQELTIVIRKPLEQMPAGSSRSSAPEPLQQSEHLPQHIKDALTRSRITWMKVTEVWDILNNYKEYKLPVALEPPNRPPGGAVYLFDRSAVRFFRKDGYKWRKKPDGRTVRETHEKLKVGDREVLNCYYAHSESTEAIQRRCYWPIESNEHIVLVHYIKSLRSTSQPQAQPSYAEVSEEQLNSSSSMQSLRATSLSPSEELEDAVGLVVQESSARVVTSGASSLPSVGQYSPPSCSSPASPMDVSSAATMHPDVSGRSSPATSEQASHPDFVRPYGQQPLNVCRQASAPAALGCTVAEQQQQGHSLSTGLQEEEEMDRLPSFLDMTDDPFMAAFDEYIAQQQQANPQYGMTGGGPPGSPSPGGADLPHHHSLPPHLPSHGKGPHAMPADFHMAMQHSSMHGVQYAQHHDFPPHVHTSPMQYSSGVNMTFPPMAPPQRCEAATQTDPEPMAKERSSQQDVSIMVAPSPEPHVQRSGQSLGSSEWGGQDQSLPRRMSDPFPSGTYQEAMAFAVHGGYGQQSTGYDQATPSYPVQPQPPAFRQGVGPFAAAFQPAGSGAVTGTESQSASSQPIATPSGSRSLFGSQHSQSDAAFHEPSPVNEEDLSMWLAISPDSPRDSSHHPSASAVSFPNPLHAPYPPSHSLRHSHSMPASVASGLFPQPHVPPNVVTTGSHNLPPAHVDASGPTRVPSITIVLAPPRPAEPPQDGASQPQHNL